MARITIKQQVAGYYCITLILGLVLFSLLTFAFFHVIWEELDPGRGPSGQGYDYAWLIALFIGSLGLVSFTVTGVAVWCLVRLDRHPVLVALARYGRVEELLQEIERELADPASYTCVGHRPFWNFALTRILRGATVLITDSWLIYLGPVLGMKFFRLDSLVLVYPEHNKVVLTDRHGVRLEIFGTEGGRARLLAEILARVPWALDHFDPDTEKSWQANRQAIITQVEQRRQTIQQKRQTDEGGAENG